MHSCRIIQPRLEDVRELGLRPGTKKRRSHLDHPPRRTRAPQCTAGRPPGTPTHEDEWRPRASASPALARRSQSTASPAGAPARKPSMAPRRGAEWPACARRATGRAERRIALCSAGAVHPVVHNDRAECLACFRNLAGPAHHLGRDPHYTASATSSHRASRRRAVLGQSLVDLRAGEAPEWYEETVGHKQPEAKSIAHPAS